MDISDFKLAISTHLNWKIKLTDFMYGIGNLTISEVPDHNTCPFGQWLNASGLTELRKVTDTSTLESLHKDVHDKIIQIVGMSKEQREGEEGQEALTQFKAKCDELVALLESMQRIVLG